MEGVIDLRRRIKGVREIGNITRAMKMVAATKLKKAQERLEAARPFARDIEALIADILHAAGEIIPSHPLTEVRPVRKAVLILISSDRGLCGAYNSNLIRYAQAYMRNHPAGPEFVAVAVGRKGRDHLRRLGIPIIAEYVDAHEFASYKRAQEIAAQVVPKFLDRVVDEASIVYSRFYSAQRQRPSVYRLLPVKPVETVGAPRREWLFEPSAAEVLNHLLPRYIQAEIYRTLLEGDAGEKGARMTSMGAATDNAENMIAELSLAYNRSRQALITREIAELMGGVEALR